MSTNSKKGQKKKNASSRKSETPSSNAAKIDELRVCKSAGNSPASSPYLNRKALSSRNGPDSINLHQNLTTSDIGQCPCYQTTTKNSVMIACIKCTQAWHVGCVNLTGLTQAPVKKLVNWKCPRCFIFPYKVQSADEKSETFAEFQKITGNITKCNEDLKDSAKAIEFFNLHIKHLVLNEHSFKENSKRIANLESGVDEIKTILSDLINTSKQSDQLDLSDVIKEVKEKLMIIEEAKGNQISDNPANGALDSDTLAGIKEAVEDVKKCGNLIEVSSKSIEKEIADLRAEFGQDSSSSPPKESTAFEHIDTLFSEINQQLQSINQHVCPKANPQLHQNLNLTLNPLTDNDDLSKDMSPAMTPNTVSPHFAQSQLSSGPICDPYIAYKEDVVANDARDKLMELLKDSSNEFKPVGNSRDVLYFGEHGYWYTGAYHEAKQTPPQIQSLLDAVRPSLPDSTCSLNSCLVTRYTGAESHIPMHCDNEVTIDPESMIVTVSLGEEREVRFSHASSNTEKCLLVKDSSVYVMSRFSQDVWKHGIDPLEEPDPTQEDEPSIVTSDSADNKSEKKTPPPSVRYSLTFRHIAPYFKNSTVVIGDSNTQHINFGKGIGTLGIWTPGKRIKAATIEGIPAPQDIGPYRNIVLHTGINNLCHENRRSHKSLSSTLKRKCDDIQQFYPNAKLFISLLLPTKSRYVNSRVTEFNSLILDITFNRKNLFVIDNSVLGPNDGCLSTKYGRYMNSGMPNANDIVHLGRNGLKVFCMNIKRCIMERGKKQSIERFSGRGGDYHGAASSRRSSGITS